MAEFYRIWTSHSTVVGQDAAGELVHHAPEQANAATPLYVWRASPSSGEAVALGLEKGIPMSQINGLPISQRLIGFMIIDMRHAVSLAFTPGRFVCA